MGVWELTALGVEPLDESVYRTLLQNPDLTRTDLLAALGLEAAELCLSLKRLEQQGMIHLDTDGEPSPVDPGIGIEQLAERRLRALQEQQLEVLSTTQSFVLRVTRGRGRTGDPGQVEPLDGADAVHERIDELAFFARREILVTQPSWLPAHEHLTGTREADLRCLRRGVALRVLAHRTALRDREPAGHLRKLADHGAEFRLLDGSFDRIAVFDRETALVQTTADATARQALMVRQNVLVHALHSFFERCWSQASDALSCLRPDEAREGLDELHLKVLQVMACTDKDEAGARELGISVRTYRARIARLLQHLNASTRFQAALLARDKGWI
ncbi:hypothetical protein STEPF1_06804 [Streptomyces sp. F-1]|nr:hypothetical protein STEPF1_06804 [Streptomyces sp. F-1]